MNILKKQNSTEENLENLKVSMVGYRIVEDNSFWNRKFPQNAQHRNCNIC